MQRNANMLKILKKVRFCRFYGFLCKNAVPSLSPRTNFCPSVKLCNILCINRLQDYKWTLEKYFASANKLRTAAHHWGGGVHTACILWTVEQEQQEAMAKGSQKSEVIVIRY